MMKDEAFQLHFSKFPEEEKLAKTFSECFDISSGRKMERFSTWYLDPHKQIKERFGIDKEILALYSPFSRTDARFLGALSQICSGSHFQNRAERLIVFLVHNGDADDVSSIIRQYLDRVVVSFTKDQLLTEARSGSFIRQRMAECLGREDLFGMSSPLTQDTYFFGRDEVVQTLITRAGSRNQHSGLFGLRKAGKTSVLYAVERRMRGERTIVEYVDCQNPGLHNNRWWAALETVVDRIYSKAWETGSRGMKRNQFYTVEKAGLQFLEDVRRVLTKQPYLACHTDAGSCVLY